MAAIPLGDFPETLFFGCGNMGQAMLAGWIAGGVPADRFAVADPAAPVLPVGVRSAGGTEQPAMLILAVKPQALAEVADAVRAHLADGAILVSVLAGVRLARLAKLFPMAKPVRLMPNLAAAIGRAPLGLATAALDDGEREAVDRWMRPLGPTFWQADEDDLDVVTALAGSGPAYLYRFVDALAQAAVALGLPEHQAGPMALATVEGAARLAAMGGEAPGALAERVASPGGSTRKGMDVLDADDALVALLTRTLTAARDRNRELAGI